MVLNDLFALIALAGALYITIPVLLIERWRRGKGLVQQSMEQNSKEVSISAIFAARNEEANIGQTLESLLQQKCENIEIIAVNDRSNDTTGFIINQFADQYPIIRAVNVEVLPSGWLGKCNALQKGVEESKGEWLLFTDADVKFDSDVVRQAINSAELYEADHLVLFPELLWQSPMEAGLLAFFTMMLGVGFQFWRVEQASLRSYVGIGAFNMIRRSLYERFAGHHALRLEIADDMKLGYLAKKYGGKSVPLYSEGKVRVRWREGAWDVVRGIIRSGFPGINFNWFRLIFATVGIVVVFILPFFLLSFNPTGGTVVFSALAILFSTISIALSARSQRIPLWTLFLYPLAAGLFVCGILLSAIVTTVRGGVGWRGTFYSIEELKRGSVK
ncbi:MAG: glycosyltransferase [Ignavibacteriae bacterium]|nr:glycosyltransferase [Ignavibacteriota bacterium]MCB9216600.1 glycosyltransferase [Ignavibacteria bacterium]